VLRAAVGEKSGGRRESNPGPDQADRGRGDLDVYVPILFHKSNGSLDYVQDWRTLQSLV
jgi:hypothetical protein